MGEHRLTKNTRWASYLTAGIALEAVSLFGFAYATDSHLLPPGLLATTIFVDGTSAVLPTSEPYQPDRLRNALDNAYEQPGGTAFFDDGTVLQQEDENVFILYPRSLGIVTGPGDPTYDASEAEATRKILAAIEQAQALEAADTDDDNGDGVVDELDDAIYVVGYSQGAGAAAQALGQLEDPSNIEQFVLIANPRRNDGGLLARFPDGTYLPLVGVSFGEGTTNPYPNDITVIQVTKQYDGVADSPKYIANVVADANAALGFYYLHRDFYQNVDLDLDNDGDVDQDDVDLAEQNPDQYAVTRSEDGVTDVLVLNPVGQLPLTRPLLDAGVPPEVVAALDPFLRAVIETSYDRPAPGEAYPSEPVHFQLLPPPSQAATDLQAIANGGAQTAELLATVPSNQSNRAEASRITAPPSTPTTSGFGWTDSAAAQSVTTTSDTAPPVVDKSGAQSVLNAAGKDGPSETPRTQRTGPNNSKTSSAGTKRGWTPGNVVRSYLGDTYRSSASGGTADTGASTTVSGSATGSSTGSLNSSSTGSSSGSVSSTGSSSGTSSASGASQ